MQGHYAHIPNRATHPNPVSTNEVTCPIINYRPHKAQRGYAFTPWHSTQCSLHQSFSMSSEIYPVIEACPHIATFLEHSVPRDWPVVYAWPVGMVHQGFLPAPEGVSTCDLGGTACGLRKGSVGCFAEGVFPLMVWWGGCLMLRW